jgi:hypothetical protein
VAEIGDGAEQCARSRNTPGSPGWPEGSVLRTPDERFANLPGFPYEPKYVEIEGLRMAWVEAGTGDPILMLHGEPTWGYLYRKMILPARGRGPRSFRTSSASAVPTSRARECLQL